jgi:diketogulonate reductase-like aldo/keto reductase
LTREKIACNQVLYHLRSRGIEYGLIPYCQQNGIAVVGYSPFGQGNFPAPFSKQGKVLETIASKHGKTARQVALNFLVRAAGVFAIPKAGKLGHVRENAGSIGWKLDSDDLRLLDSVFPPPQKDQALDMI